MGRALDIAFAAAGAVIMLTGCGVAMQPRPAEPGGVSSSGSVLVTGSAAAALTSAPALVQETTANSPYPATGVESTTGMTLSSQGALVVSASTPAPPVPPSGASKVAAPMPVLTPPPAAKPVTRVAEADQIVALLATLAVKGRAPKTGYDRALFGPAWTDDVTVAGGHNGCDTRNDILRRDLTSFTLKATSNGCTVLAGTLHDAYTGRTIDFTRGQATSGAVQIDHVVALMDAWQKGAQGRSMAERRNLANDPLNLQAVDGPTNAQKGAGDAATWLPPNKSFRCTYVSRQVEVKAKYRLWVTQAEKNAIGRVLATCGASRTAPGTIPGPTAAPRTSTVAPRTTAAPKPTPAPEPSTIAPKPPVPKPGDCYPLSNGGNCYNAGQMCAKRYRGQSGVAANGAAIKCVEMSGGWHWRNA